MYLHKKNNYDNALKVKAALQLYFSKYHFEDGGYNLKWFKIKIGAFYIPLPNTKARVEAVKIHDIHHIITEYKADWQGEVEISAWEIAAGCGSYYVAWLLNASSFFLGIFLFPQLLFKAFMRGRKTKRSLYKNVAYDEILLNKSVGELRESIEPDVEPANTRLDLLLFALCVLLSLLGGFLFFYFGWKISRTVMMLAAK